MLALVVLVIASLINLTLGYVVYVKNSRSATNRLFLLLTFSLTGWSIVSYISIHPVGFSQLVWIRSVMTLAVLLCLSVYLTFNVFPNFEMPPAKRIHKPLVAYSLVVLLLTQTPFIFKGIVVKSGTVSPVPNAGIIAFAIAVIGLLGGGVVSIVRKFIHARGQLRAQLRFVLLGLAGTFSLIFLTNFVAVVLFNNSFFIAFGPSYTLIFSGALAYAIVRHRLFDIRAAVARGIAYVLSLVTISVIYGAIVFGLFANLPGSSVRMANSQRLLYIGFALVTALLFPRIKQFFDKVTNKIFYQDAYDSQRLFNDLNKILVANVELEKLATESLKIINNNLKPEFYAIALEGRSKSAHQRVVGTVSKEFRVEDIEAAHLHRTIARITAPVLVADLIVDEHKELARILNKNNIAILARLGGGRNKKGLGYIILGPKKNGRSYTDQDVQVMEAVANELVIAIENALHFEEIQNFAVTMQEKVQHATKELRHSNERLRTLDQTKDDFISMASHQLRTPLTSVKGYLSMVLEGDAGQLNENQKKLLTQSFISSQRMVYLIADLLNLSRLNTGKFVIEPVSVNLVDVVESEMGQLAETAKSRGIKLTFEPPERFPELMLDENKTHQVVMNFLDNAIYYTRPGGEVRIELEETPAAVEYRVVDNGIGVPKSEQHHLFTKFYRAGNAKKARPDGTGLGLFMAKKVIVAQGGAIIFESEEGKGSTFGFRFSKVGHLAPEEHVASQGTKDKSISH